MIDPKHALTIPGVRGGRLISGKDREKGATYECAGVLDGVGRGTIEIELMTADRPCNVSVTLKRVELPPGVRLKRATAAWSLSEIETGCQAILRTEGEVGGVVAHLPGFEKFLETMIRRTVRETLRNVKREVENPTSTP